MSLIKCYECSKEISDMAESCPHCGVGKAIECHECSKQISKLLNKCPHCGAPKVRFIKIDNRVIKFILLSLTIFSGFWVWYFFMRCIVDYEYLNEEEFLIHLFSGLICTALTFYLPYHAFYKLSKNKKDTAIKKYKISSIRFNSRLHLISSLILLTSSCYLVADILHTINLVYYRAIHGLDLNQHPDAPTVDFISIFSATLVSALIISFIYFIIRRLLNKETSFLRVFYITSYLMSLLLIIYYVSLFINMQ